jgi:hypothetical protein
MITAAVRAMREGKSEYVVGILFISALGWILSDYEHKK